jgi:hypothetical protein
MTTPPEPPPAPAEPPKERLDKIEAEQERQGSVLTEILALVKGKGAPEPAAGDPPKPDPGDMYEQMKRAVKEVNAEKPPPAPAKPEPEVPPREPGRRRDKVARFIFGKAADR